MPKRVHLRGLMCVVLTQAAVEGCDLLQALGNWTKEMDQVKAQP